MLVHIGYQKASSTFLQQRVFLPQYGYWPLFPDRKEGWFLNELLVDPPQFKFDADAVKAAVDLRMAARPDPGLVPVISAEILVGIPFDITMGSSKANADRIAECFPDAKVLIIVREQRSIVLSRYTQYVRGGGTRCIEEFLHKPTDTILARSKWMGVYPAFFEYDKLVGYYRSKLGASRVLVLAFEMLKKDSRAYVQKISAFSGANTDTERIDFSVVKEAIPVNAIGARRVANSFLSNDPDNPFSRLMPAVVYWRATRPAVRMLDVVARRFNGSAARKRLEARIERILGDHYVASNQRLAEMTGIDLGSYGYRI